MVSLFFPRFWAIKQFIIVYCSDVPRLKLTPFNNNTNISVYYIAFPPLPQIDFLLPKIWAIKRNHVTTIHQGTFVPKSTVLPRNNLTLRLPASCVHGARVLRPQRPRLASTAPASCVHSARVLRPQRPHLASELPASCVRAARVLRPAKNCV